MKFDSPSLLGLAALLSMLLPTVTQASNIVGTVYYATTTQAGANTTVDNDHLLQWVSPNLSQACVTASCQLMDGSITAAWGWTFGGGIFELKDNGADAAITLSLFDGIVTGAPGALIGNLVASKTIAAGTISNQYAPVSFFFDNPVTLTAGHDYVMLLTSTASTAGSNQYFVKSNGSLLITDSPTGTGGNSLPATDPAPAVASLPEPGTMWTALGVLLTVGFRRRRRSSL